MVAPKPGGSRSGGGPPEAAASGEGDRSLRGQRLCCGASGGGGAGARGAPHAGERHEIGLPRSASRVAFLLWNWRRRGWGGQLETGRVGGFYRGYRRGGERAEEERRPRLLRSPRGSRDERRAAALGEIKIRGCLCRFVGCCLGQKRKELCVFFASWRLPWAGPPVAGETPVGSAPLFEFLLV